MTSRFLLLVTLSGGILLSSSSADAAPLRLAVESTPRCPDAARFQELVRAAEPQAQITDDASAPLADVHFESRGDKFHGELRWREGDPRVAEAADCTTLARALALMVAMKSNEPPPSPPAAPEPIAEPTPVVSVVQPKPPAAEHIEPPPPSAAGEHGFVLGGIARSQVLDSSFSPGVGIGYVTSSKTGWPFSVSSMTSYVTDSNSIQQVELVTSALSVCPLGLRSWRLSIYTCVRGEIGAKSTRVNLPAGDFHDSAFYASAGFGTQIRWDVTDSFFMGIETAVVYGTRSRISSPGGAVVSTDVPPGATYLTNVSYPVPSQWSVPATITAGIAW